MLVDVPVSREGHSQMPISAMISGYVEVHYTFSRKLL
jgi:hypothetical protein